MFKHLFGYINLCLNSHSSGDRKAVLIPFMFCFRGVDLTLSAPALNSRVKSTVQLRSNENSAALA